MLVTPCRNRSCDLPAPSYGRKKVPRPTYKTQQQQQKQKQMMPDIALQVAICTQAIGEARPISLVGTMGAGAGCPRRVPASPFPSGRLLPAAAWCPRRPVVQSRGVQTDEIDGIEPIWLVLAREEGLSEADAELTELMKARRYRRRQAAVAKERAQQIREEAAQEWQRSVRRRVDDREQPSSEG